MIIWRTSSFWTKLFSTFALIHNPWEGHGYALHSYPVPVAVYVMSILEVRYLVLLLVYVHFLFTLKTYFLRLRHPLQQNITKTAATCKPRCPTYVTVPPNNSYDHFNHSRNQVYLSSIILCLSSPSLLQPLHWRCYEILEVLFANRELSKAAATFTHNLRRG